MQALSERAYAERIGMSRGAIQKAKTAGRLVLFADGSIDAAASDARRVAATDPSKQRATVAAPAGTPAASPAPRLKPVPDAALAAVGDTLRDSGMTAPVTGGGTTFLQAKTANEVLKAQERKLRLAKLKGEPAALAGGECGVEGRAALVAQRPDRVDRADEVGPVAATAFKQLVLDHVFA